MPENPLLTGVFGFLAYPAALFRWGLISGVVWLAVVTTLTGFAYFQAGGVAVMVGLGCALGLVAIGLTGGAFVAVTCLAIVQESSTGEDEITGWPDLNFLEWWMEGLYVLVACVYSATPGMLVLWLLRLLGVPSLVGTFFAMLSLFAFFPIVLLSLLESASLNVPLTRPILNSLQSNRRLWVIFYVQSITILVVLLVSGLIIKLQSSLLVTVMAAIWSLALMLYFRLLGRLAWATSVETDES